MLRTKEICRGPANRGAAAGYGKIHTADAQLVALDQRAGRFAWNVSPAGVEGQAETREDDPAADGTTVPSL